MTIEVKPKDGTVEVDGLKLHYLDWGNEVAQPLLLLHGFSSHAHSWDTFAAALRDHFHIVALDQRGHGESDWAPEYSMASAVADVQGVVDALRLHRMVLVGLSMGGSRAFHYAAAHADEVERLVIVDSGPRIAAAGGARIMTGVQAQDEFDSEEEAFQYLRAGNPRPSEQQVRLRLRYNLKQLPNGRFTWKWDKALRDPSRPFPRPSPDEGWNAVRGVACQTLLVRGAESDILSPETANEMVREMKDCTLVTIEDSGHPVPMDRPAEFEAAVRSWLGV